MRIYEARPKGALTGRHKKALHAAGFGWYGTGWFCKAERPPKVWGCNIRVLPEKKPDVIRTEEDWRKWLKKNVH